MQLARISDYRKPMDSEEQPAPIEPFTAIPNLVLDKLMAELDTMRELKIVLAIARKTIGYQGKQDGDIISLSQFVALTGMERESVTTGIKKCLEHGIIERHQRGQSFLYKLSLVGISDYLSQREQERQKRSENQTSDMSASRNIRPEVVGISDPELVGISDTQKKELNKEKEIKNVPKGTATPPPDEPVKIPLIKQLREEYDKAAAGQGLTGHKSKDQAGVVGKAFQATFCQPPDYKRLVMMTGPKGLNSGWELIRLILSLSNQEVHDNPHDYLQQAVNSKLRSKQDDRRGAGRPGLGSNGTYTTAERATPKPGRNGNGTGPVGTNRSDNAEVPGSEEWRIRNEAINDDYFREKGIKRVSREEWERPYHQQHQPEPQPARGRYYFEQ